MAVVALTATKRSNLSTLDSPQVETQVGVNLLEVTVEVGSADSATSTYHIAHLPANARISGLSRLMLDDLASAGAPTIDIGTYNAADGTADDADAINNGIDAATASNNVPFILDPANVGKYLWELAGCTSNPGGFIDIKLALLDAAVNAGGTVSAMILYRIE